MRTCLLFTLFSLSVSAQFADLATTDDGRQTYFTSTLQFSGAAPSLPLPRVYRIVESGVELFDERSARSPQVSASGLTVGLTLAQSTELRGSQTAVLGPGTLRMSRNARWAVVTGVQGPPPANTPAGSVLINLETGDRTTLPQGFQSSMRFTLASDGTVLLDGPLGQGLWRQGTFTALLFALPAAGPRFLAISDDARVLVYSQPLSTGLSQLVARNLATGTETILFPQSSITGTRAVAIGLSSDGRWVLYTVAGKAVIVNTTTGQSTVLLLPAGELCMDGTLSGDGTVAILVTTTGRMISVHAADGSIQTLIGPTAYAAAFPVLVPGSLARLTGAFPGNIGTLRGRLFLDGVAVPVVFDDGQQLGVQVPWEVNAPGVSAFRVESAGPSPFSQNELVQINSMLPILEPLSAGQTSLFPFVAIRGNFSGLVTANPSPGDIIAVYATGLGPVDGPVQTGQPAPLGRLLRIQGQFTCRFNPYADYAETLFAGLAPGLTGFYQINLRLPPGPDPGPITGGECKWSGSGIEGGFTFALPANR